MSELDFLAAWTIWSQVSFFSFNTVMSTEEDWRMTTEGLLRATSLSTTCAKFLSGKNMSGSQTEPYALQVFTRAHVSLLNVTKSQWWAILLPTYNTFFPQRFKESILLQKSRANKANMDFYIQYLYTISIYKNMLTLSKESRKNYTQEFAKMWGPSNWVLSTKRQLGAAHNISDSSHKTSHPRAETSVVVCTELGRQIEIAFIPKT